MEKQLSEVLEKLENVVTSNAKISKDMSKLAGKVQKLELKGKKKKSCGSVVNAEHERSTETTHEDGIIDDHEDLDTSELSENNEAEGGFTWPHLSVGSQKSVFAAIQTEDLQSEYKVVSDKYSRMAVSSDLRFNNNRSGIKQASKELSNVMCNAAKYMETGLRILTHVQRKSQEPEYQINVQLQELYVVLYAGLRYLQEDHVALRFGSQYGTRTQMIYKDLSKNTSSYPVGSLDRLENAMRFAAIPPEAPVQTAPRRGGFSGWNGGPRGGYGNFGNRGRFRGRGFNGMNDGQAFAPRSVPFDRQQSQQD